MAPLKGLLDTLKSATFRPPNPVFCPNCRSHKVRLKESYGILPRCYRCEDCGYEGPLVLELEQGEEDPR
jgi:predicted RNA-binding Zn-ribbon protein involved in translation (DUF1610 family)